MAQRLGNDPVSRREILVLEFPARFGQQLRCSSGMLYQGPGLFDAALNVNVLAVENQRRFESLHGIRKPPIRQMLLPCA